MIVWALVKKFGGWVMAALSFVAMLITIWFSAKKTGKAAAKVEAAEEKAADREAIAVRQINEQRAETKQQIEVVKNATEIAADNSSIPDDEVTKRLRDEWQRD